MSPKACEHGNLVCPWQDKPPLRLLGIVSLPDEEDAGISSPPCCWDLSLKPHNSSLRSAGFQVSVTTQVSTIYLNTSCFLLLPLEMTSSSRHSHPRSGGFVFLAPSQIHVTGHCSPSPNLGFSTVPPAAFSSQQWKTDLNNSYVQSTAQPQQIPASRPCPSLLLQQFPHQQKQRLSLQFEDEPSPVSVPKISDEVVKVDPPRFSFLVFFDKSLQVDVPPTAYAEFQRLQRVSAVISKVPARVPVSLSRAMSRILKSSCIADDLQDSYITASIQASCITAAGFQASVFATVDLQTSILIFTGLQTFLCASASLQGFFSASAGLECFGFTTTANILKQATHHSTSALSSPQDQRLDSSGFKGLL
ncbi:hypothetical protein CRENBAI_010321 [Crenichthys baileyi]|uniref:Uncharacterized protein n=1 Tax=Crenichthys baileyi TaxID=28760 RepID=A0AAV9QME7_9TELE